MVEFLHACATVNEQSFIEWTLAGNSLQREVIKWIWIPLTLAGPEWLVIWFDVNSIVHTRMSKLPTSIHILKEIGLFVLIDRTVAKQRNSSGFHLFYAIDTSYGRLVSRRGTEIREKMRLESSMSPKCVPRCNERKFHKALWMWLRTWEALKCRSQAERPWQLSVSDIHTNAERFLPRDAGAVFLSFLYCWVI
jgi:hypothetical protein